MTSILIIDDNERQGLADLLGATWRHPSSVSEQEVLDADLIIIDQFLTEWTFDPSSPATTHPRGGLAVAAVLRSQLGTSSTPIVIFTGALDALTAHLPSRVRQPALADEFGVEWVADRTELEFQSQIQELLLAATTLPSTWHHRTFADSEIVSWLGLDDSSEWGPSAIIDFEECRPELSGMADRTSGAAFLRWFLHRILPFPTFLLNDLQAATRLGLTVGQFQELADGPAQSELVARVQATAYVGQLSTFLGRRWWRAGVDWVLEAVDGWNTGELTDAEALQQLNGSPLETLGPGDWLIPLDGDLQESAPAQREELTRILPSSWPAFADDPYTRTEDLDTDPRLSAWRSILK